MRKPLIELWVALLWLDVECHCPMSPNATWPLLLSAICFVYVWPMAFWLVIFFFCFSQCTFCGYVSLTHLCQRWHIKCYWLLWNSKCVTKILLLASLCLSASIDHTNTTHNYWLPYDCGGLCLKSYQILQQQQQPHKQHHMLPHAFVARQSY